jgi:hypothetical protein
MRSLSIILAVGLVLAGPSMAGSADDRLPGSGAFAYNGPSAHTAPAIHFANSH